MRALDPHQMFHISVQEFKEYVRLSHSWSELARRCGEPTKLGCVSTLKEKVLFLKLDTQHFTVKKCSETARARRAWIAGISPQEFTEFVRLSHSWSDLASRCGERAKKKKGGINDRIARVLKQKVLFLNLDTQHFRNPLYLSTPVSR